MTLLTLALAWMAVAVIWTLGYIVGHAFGRQRVRCWDCEVRRDRERLAREAMGRS